MYTRGICIYLILLSTTIIKLADANTRKDRPRKKEDIIAVSKGTQCYNCLSLDHPGCWNPEHPDYANITVPNTDCYMPGTDFICIVITAEAAQIVELSQETGPVRARTCVPAKDFKKDTISYSLCSKLSKELASSEVFSRVLVTRPKCSLCRTPLCVD